MTRRGLTILLTVALLFAGACGGNDDSGSENSAKGTGESADALPVTVTAKNFKFRPDALEGHATHTVDLTLVNEDDATHSFTIDEMEVDIEAEGGQETQSSFTPEETGTFEFYCKYHPETMKGEFEVS